MTVFGEAATAGLHVTRYPAMVTVTRHSGRLSPFSVAMDRARAELNYSIRVQVNVIMHCVNE